MLSYKILLLVVFAAAVVSLASALVFMMKDNSKKKRTANALLIRVSLCGLFIILLIYGFYNGYIHPHSPIGLVK